jgi:hypothetical protein
MMNLIIEKCMKKNINNHSNENAFFGQMFHFCFFISFEILEQWSKFINDIIF